MQYYSPMYARILEGSAPLCVVTLGAHAQEGYGTCLVCVSVCYSSSANIARFYAQNKVRRGLS